MNPARAPKPEYLTPVEVVEVLRIEREGDPLDICRSLCRRQGLKRSGKGRIFLVKRTDLESWLQGDRRGRMQKTGRRVTTAAALEEVPS